MLVTVLCIFTIVGSSIGILWDVTSLFSIQIRFYEIIYPIWLPALGIFFGTGKILAVVFMLKMKKLGFYIYTPLEAGMACLSMVSGKIQMDYMDVSFERGKLLFQESFLTIASIAMWVILSLAFLIAYGSQLSKME